MTIMSEPKIGSLEDEALKRKERLLALKRKRNHEEQNEKDNENNSNKETLPKPKFRSYQPEDDSLKQALIPAGKPANIQDEVKDQLAAGKSRVVIEELDIQNLAPRKPDWDLKRDVAKKLEILEKRTQRAIAELIRDRLKQRQDVTDLADAVNAITNADTSEDRET
ncbi:coiled-coil domain-containing protein 12 [Chrysoperla carnea]|uniref:coiled-coil domain-containing protein 12 n=1 Tax=Chrysoperla carnea TaxID=189513 RepID=UPI001D075D41|nr:coiled-coil domain-containing protein 12 [Chrysoperla carnea]